MGTRKYNGNLFGYSVDTHIKKWTDQQAEDKNE
jgi:hypothetical protein